MTKMASFETKKVACITRKTLFAIFKFLKYANQPSHDVIYSTKFGTNMVKKDISANLYQKCWILCSKILLNVLHNLSLTVLLPQQQTGFQTLPILKPSLSPSAYHFHICKWCLIYMIQQAYQYVSWSLCPCLNFRTQISREKY